MPLLPKCVIHPGMRPDVEIFVLSYNSEKTLARTLRSVLAQTYSPKRVILSDNGSTDGSLAVARSFETQGLEIRARNPGTGGIFSHYNLCVSEARAPYLAIFHADDLYEPEIIDQEVALLEREPGLTAVLTGGSYIGPKDEPLWNAPAPAGLTLPRLDPLQVLRILMTGGNSFLLAPSALFRRLSLSKLGPFALDCGNSADVEMWLRILFEGGGLGYLPEPLFRHRISATQASGSGEASRTEESEYFKVLDRYVRRAPAEALPAYEALRHLDLLQAGLNRVALCRDPYLLLEQLRWFRATPDPFHHFGMVDRIKVRGALALARGLESKLGPALARTWNRCMEPRTSRPLRWMLKAKSWIRS